MSDGYKLWEVSRELCDAMEEKIDPETGEVLGLDLSLIDALKMTRAEKIKNCIMYIKNQEANAAVFDDALKQMKERQAVFSNRAKRTSDYLESLTSEEQDAGILCPAGKLSWSKSKKVEIYSLDDLPMGFFSFERKADKNKIRDAINNGSAAFKGIAHIQECTNFKVK